MSTFAKTVIVPAHVVIQEVEGGAVLLNLHSERFFDLDETGTRMWAALSAASTIQEAYDVLLAEYDVAPAVLRQDLEKLIGQLLENGLLVLTDGRPDAADAPIRAGGLAPSRPIDSQPAGGSAAQASQGMATVLAAGQRFEPGPEVLRFVRLCLRGRWEPQALRAARRLTAQTELDWAALIRVAEGGRLGPLLYQTVRGQDLVPPAVEETLRAARLGQAMRERLLRREWATVLGQLAEQGVEVLLLKGAALAETVYAAAGLRPMEDLDLLVRRESVGPALDTLDELGYLRQGLEVHPGVDLAYENEVMLTKAGPVDFVVEIHWSLFDTPFHQQRLPMEWFWQTAIPVQMEGTPTRVLGPEAQILHLCGHMMLHHGSGEALRLLWLHDVAEVLVHHRERIDWHELLHRAQQCQLVLPLQEGLRQVADDWGAPIPADALSRLEALRPSAEEAQVVAWRTASQRPVAQRFWSDLASMAGWRSRLRYAWSHLFPSASYMQSRYQIPHPALLPLYYPYRWWLGLRSALALRRSG